MAGLQHSSHANRPQRDNKKQLSTNELKTNENKCRLKDKDRRNIAVSKKEKEFQRQTERQKNRKITRHKRKRMKEICNQKELFRTYLFG